MRAACWGGLLVVLTAAAAHSDEHHNSADLSPADRTLEEMRFRTQQIEEGLERPLSEWNSRSWEDEEVALKDASASRRPTAARSQRGLRRASVQQFVKPSGANSFTVGVMPGSREMGEGAGAAVHVANNTGDTIEVKKKAQAKAKLEAADDEEKSQKAEMAAEEKKLRTAAAKKKRKAAAEKQDKNMAADEAQSKSEQAEKRATATRDAVVEKNIKKAEMVLEMERQGARTSEVKHKEAEQVHKNFITKELAEKEDKQKAKERAKKSQILDLTQELNDKAEGKKQSLMGPPGGALIADGTFKLSSAYLAGQQQEAKTKVQLAKQKENTKKERARLKEREKKAELTEKRVRIADTAERMEKDKEASEANNKKVEAAKARELLEKDVVSEKATKESKEKAKESVSKRPVNYTALNASTVKGSGAGSGSGVEFGEGNEVEEMEAGLGRTWNELAGRDINSDRTLLPSLYDDHRVLQLIQEAEDPHARGRELLSMGGSGSAAGSAGDEVRNAINASDAKKELALEAHAREKGEKAALDEQDEARAKADKLVEEAQSKEQQAKKAVEVTKKAVVKQEADAAKEIVDEDSLDAFPSAGGSGSGSGSGSGNGSGSGSGWGLPNKPWSGYTNEDLKKMLQKAKTKEEFLCKAAELLPNLASKAKAASDQAYVESRRPQVKRVVEIQQLDEVEASEYQERKTKSYSQAKEVSDKARDRADRATGECDDARRDRDTLRRKIAEAKTTGFVKANLPKAAYSFQDKEIKMYPDCRLIFSKKDFQQWLALKSDRDVEMAEKERDCRIRALEREKVRINALEKAVDAAKKSLENIKGASRCVLLPAINRMFSMMDGENPVATPAIKNFIKAVELQRKMVDTGAPNVTRDEMMYSDRMTNELADPLDSLGEQRKFGVGDEYEEYDSVDGGDLGESAGVSAKSTTTRAPGTMSKMDRIELGAAISDFERKEDTAYSQQVQEKKKQAEAAKKLLDEKTVELKEKQGDALDREIAAKKERKMKAAEKVAKKAPEAKYTCLFDEFQEALGPSAKKLTMKYKLSKHAVGSELNKLKGLMDKAEEAAKTPQEGDDSVRLGAPRREVAAESFTTSRSFPVRRQMEYGDLGESGDGETLPGCAAFYAKNSPKKEKPLKPKKKKVEQPPPPVEEEELGESASVKTSGRKLLQGMAGATEENPVQEPPPSEAKNPRDLRLKIQEYVIRMTTRASSLADQLMEDVRQDLVKAHAQAQALKIKIKNAVNLVNVERLKLGSEEALEQGRCVGKSCFHGTMFKATNEGDEVTWMCRRGLKSKEHTREAFSCSMTTPKGKMHMCVGKEVWFGQFWVPFIKEVRCPEDMGKPCEEGRQCGSEDLPLTKGFTQKRLRNECAQL